MKTLRIAMIALAMLTVSSGAFAFGKGSNLLAITVGSGDADWVQPASTGYLTSEPQLPEIRIGLDYWHMTRDDMAFSLSGGIGTFSETDKAGTAAAPGSPDLKSSISSFHLRVGGDHVAKVSDKILFYVGGGVTYWSGSFKYESGSPSVTSPTVSRYGFDGRLGGFYQVTPSVMFGGRMGHTFAYAMADQDGAKANWTTKDVNGEAVLAFSFGSH